MKVVRQDASATALVLSDEGLTIISNALNAC